MLPYFPANRFGTPGPERSESTTRSGTEIVQRNAELMRKAWHSYIDMMAQMTGRSADELGRAFPNANPMSGEDARKSAEQSTRNVDAVLDSGTVLAKGIENVTREWFDFARGSVEQNLASLSSPAGRRAPSLHARTRAEPRIHADRISPLVRVFRHVDSTYLPTVPKTANGSSHNAKNTDGVQTDSLRGFISI